MVLVEKVGLEKVRVVKVVPEKVGAEKLGVVYAVEERESKLYCY